jgi:CRP-like cAMP-binding protein
MANYTVVKKDEFLFEEGDFPEFMYIVRSGQFSLFVRNSNRGRDASGGDGNGSGNRNGDDNAQLEKELTLVGPGSLIGEMALFDKKPRSASARATVDSSVVKLPYDQLEKQLEELPDWVKITMRTMCEKLRQTNKKF